MKAFLALVVFEIRERKAMLVASAVASVLPVLAPVLALKGTNTSADIREVAMWVMVGGLVPLFAMLLGLNFIGRDLSEGRLGFYFAQPMSGPTIWFGKLMAVVLLIWAAQLIMMLPTALLSGNPWRIVVAKDLFLNAISPWASSLTMWIVPVAVILLTHALGIVWRARSVWIVVDLVAFGLLVAAIRWVGGPYLQIFAAYVMVAISAWILVSTLIGLVVAGAFQLTAGRVDARRGHRALSGAFWTTLAVALVLISIWSLWVRSATPGDLNRVTEVSPSAGDWIGVTGASAGRFDFHPGFIINVEDGRWISAHSGSSVHHRSVEFSADMSRAVWPSPDGFKQMKLMVVDLNDADPQPYGTGIVLQGFWRDLAVSETGSRVAIVQDDTVLVHDVEGGALLGAAMVGGEFAPYVVEFANERAVVILAGKKEKVSDDPSMVRTFWKRYRFDLESRVLDEGETIDTTWRWWDSQTEIERGYSFELHEVEGQHRLWLVNSSDGDSVADLGVMPAWSDVRVVSDGRIVVIHDEDQAHHVDVFNPEGGLIHRIALQTSLWMNGGGEVSPGILAVTQSTLAGDNEKNADRQTSLVDLASGTVAVDLAGVSSIFTRWRLRASAGVWDVGSVATRLMEGRNGSLHLWNPETNELEQIIPVPD